MRTPQGEPTDDDFDWVTAQRGWEAWQRLHGGDPHRRAEMERLPKTPHRCDAVVPAAGGWEISPRLCECCGRPGAEGSETLGRAFCGRCWQLAFWRAARRGRALTMTNPNDKENP